VRSRKPTGSGRSSSLRAGMQGRCALVSAGKPAAVSAPPQQSGHAVGAAGPRLGGGRRRLGHAVQRGVPLVQPLPDHPRAGGRLVTGRLRRRERPT
jgi:hypothetical protein